MPDQFKDCFESVLKALEGIIEQKETQSSEKVWFSCIRPLIIFRKIKQLKISRKESKEETLNSFVELCFDQIQSSAFAEMENNLQNFLSKGDETMRIKKLKAMTDILLFIDKKG